MLETIGDTLSVSGICRTNKQRSSVCTNNEKKGFLKNYKNAASKNAALRNPYVKRFLLTYYGPTIYNHG